MKSLIVVAVLLNLSGISWGKADVEIQEQRLIKFPQNYPRYQSSERSVDTQRILNEIEKINLEFGYTKKEPQITPRIDIESYFYPRPAYHPLHQRYNNGVAVPATIRQLNVEPNNHPFNTEIYFYPTPYLQLPNVEIGQLFSRTDKSEKSKISAVENDLLRGKLVRDYNQEKALVEAVKNIVNEMKDTKKPPPMDIAVIINKIAEESRSTHKRRHQVLKPFAFQNRTLLTEEDDSVVVNVNDTKEKLAATTPAPSTPIQSKTFFSRPKPKPQSSNVHLYLKTTESPEIIGSHNEVQEVSQPPPPPAVKGPFGDFINGQKEQVMEALRQGGIIIQRLRVKEGGIAIAGPGGVATAGSGGTAIVGPGGIALTHPRSLAIAGPGARVVAVPENIDLQKLALRSNARQLPAEGVLVATGPVVYYNPASTT